MSHLPVTDPLPDAERQKRENRELHVIPLYLDKMKIFIYSSITNKCFSGLNLLQSFIAISFSLLLFIYFKVDKIGTPWWPSD